MKVRSRIRLLVAAAFLCAAAVLGSDSAVAEKAKLKMIFWTFQPQAVQSFIDEFMRRNPDIEVTLDGAPSAEYNAKASLMLRSGTPFDVMYIRDATLPQWVENGWAWPIDSCPGVDEAKKDMIPLARDFQSYNGKLYGLTYFTGILLITVNKQMMKDAGFDSPPRTFEGWVEQAREVKRKGIVEYPMAWPIKPAGWGGVAVWATMTAAKGGKLFDESFNVTPDGMWTLKWWRKTFEEGLSDPASVSWDNAKTATVFMDGQAYMQWSLHIYAGNQFANHPEKSKVRGQAMLVEPPGTGATVGFGAMYGINAASENKDAACKLVTFLGGKDANGAYTTPRAWVEAAALTWGQRDVVKDPAVRASLESWGADPDLLAKYLEQAIAMSEVIPFFRALWYFEWQETSEKLLQEVLSGNLSPEDAAKQMADRAKQLERRYKRR